MTKITVIVMIMTCMLTAVGCGAETKEEDTQETEMPKSYEADQTSSVEPWMQEWYITSDGTVSYFTTADRTKEAGTLEPGMGIFVDLNTSDDENLHFALNQEGNVEYYIPANIVKNYKILAVQEE